MRGFRIDIYLIAACMLCLGACTPNVPYHHFEEIRSKGSAMGDGWDKEDTLFFAVDTLRVTGNYTLSLNVRTTDVYPYRNLSMMVDETVFLNRGMQGYQSRAHRVYPVHLETVDAEGKRIGTGMSQHDLSRVLSCQYLHQGDSIEIKVIHKMRRLVLPGITDVGIKLEK